MSYHSLIESHGINATVADFFGGSFDVCFSGEELDKLVNLDTKTMRKVVAELKTMAQIQDYIIMSEFHFTQIDPTARLEHLPHLVDLLREHVHDGNNLIDEALIVLVEVKEFWI